MREQKSFLSILNMMPKTSTTIQQQSAVNTKLTAYCRTEMFHASLNMNGLEATITFFAVSAHFDGQGGYFSAHLVYLRCEGSAARLLLPCIFNITILVINISSMIHESRYFTLRSTSFNWKLCRNKFRLYNCRQLFIQV